MMLDTGGIKKSKQANISNISDIDVNKREK